MRPLASQKGVLSFHMTLNKSRTQVRYITDGLPTINYNHMTRSTPTSNIVCVLWTLTIGLKCLLFLKVQDKSSKFHPFCNNLKSSRNFGPQIIFVLHHADVLFIKLLYLGTPLTFKSTLFGVIQVTSYIMNKWPNSSAAACESHPHLMLCRTHAEVSVPNRQCKLHFRNANASGSDSLWFISSSILAHICLCPCVCLLLIPPSLSRSLPLPGGQGLPCLPSEFAQGSVTAVSDPATHYSSPVVLPGSDGAVAG